MGERERYKTIHRDRRERRALNKFLNHVTPHEQDGTHSGKGQDLLGLNQDESHATVQLGSPSS
jgi:hypothetical protein